MKKDLVRFVGILIIILFFSYFVYPTQYYFTATGADGGYHNIHRINRITGNVDILSTDGWNRVVQKK